MTYICLQCGIAERIPKEIIETIEFLDEDFSPLTAPQFSCEKCGGEMYPQYYRNFCGIEFQLSDVQDK
ncbi:hypothetical protein FA707_03700 [Vagococcus zengguangii]|uniref:Uncharacterized protein n=1 Tax=Vagococcus zengguangii TaxID=2571750 RepID=A0A4D7CVI7_9ENTE|nr:hypothetical protein FA707_03535 [Vagococcus zengguangii]QCI86118.1 hypothetical protein FA707_03700 [Vagococcus zengguangii]